MRPGLKRLWIFVALIGTCGAAAFVVTHRVCNGDKCDEMAWLTREFKLTSQQATEIRALREKYEPVCKSHCESLTAARERLTRARATLPPDSPEFNQAIQDWRNVSASCADNTRTHVRAVAAVMSHDEGQRYLALVLPQIAQHEHDLPTGLK